MSGGVSVCDRCGERVATKFVDDDGWCIGCQQRDARLVTDGGRDVDEADWPLFDVQADPDDHRDDVQRCLGEHLDNGDVRVTSIGRDPRSIIAVCESCEVKYWFEEVAEEHIPGTESWEDR